MRIIYLMSIIFNDVVLEIRLYLSILKYIRILFMSDVMYKDWPRNEIDFKHKIRNSNKKAHKQINKKANK